MLDARPPLQQHAADDVPQGDGLLQLRVRPRRGLQAARQARARPDHPGAQQAAQAGAAGAAGAGRQAAVGAARRPARAARPAGRHRLLVARAALRLERRTEARRRRLLDARAAVGGARRPRRRAGDCEARVRRVLRVADAAAADALGQPRAVRGAPDHGPAVRAHRRRARAAGGRPGAEGRDLAADASRHAERRPVLARARRALRQRRVQDQPLPDVPGLDRAGAGDRARGRRRAATSSTPRWRSSWRRSTPAASIRATAARRRTRRSTRRSRRSTGACSRPGCRTRSTRRPSTPSCAAST